MLLFYFWKASFWWSFICITPSLKSCTLVTFKASICGFSSPSETESGKNLKLQGEWLECWEFVASAWVILRYSEVVLFTFSLRVEPLSSCGSKNFYRNFLPVKKTPYLCTWSNKFTYVSSQISCHCGPSLVATLREPPSEFKHFYSMADPSLLM